MAKAPAKKEDVKPKGQGTGVFGQGKPKIDLGNELLKWSVIPFMHQRRKAVIFTAATLAFAALVWYAAGLVYAIVAIAISLGASASFMLPTTYRLCEHGIEMSSATTSTIRKWAVFRKYYPAEDGVLLAYYPRSVREKVARGLFFYFGDMDSARVLRVLDDCLDES